MSVGIWVLRLSSLGLEGGERAWYTLNAHASAFSVKFDNTDVAPCKCMAI